MNSYNIRFEKKIARDKSIILCFSYEINATREDNKKGVECKTFEKYTKIINN